MSAPTTPEQASPNPGEEMEAAWQAYEKLPDFKSRRMDFFSGYFAGAANGTARMLKGFKPQTENKTATD